MDDGILVGDVGGTNVRFAIARRVQTKIVIEHFQKFGDDNALSFEQMLKLYLDQLPLKPARACFALAGPIDDGEVLLTNRGWTVSERHLQQTFGFDNVLLINDFAAMARSVPEADFDGLQAVIDGKPLANAPILVAGPGTGFGVATLFKSPSGRWSVITGEGGHMAFAPRDDLEFRLSRILLREQGYVSNELVASGSGLDAVHSAFCEIFGRERVDLSPKEMRQHADNGDEMFQKLIQVRANTVMSAVGDLVLANGAMGGVVLAGGVTERLVDYLKSDDARLRFQQRGAISHYIRKCPVRMMVDPHAPLIGAAAYFEQESRP